MRKKFYRNIAFGFGGQLIVLLLGIIIPRFLITSYGSDVNGLISTITQIFTYMALMEAGIGQAARNSLYKPISANDKQGISYIASVAQRYFRKITLYYAIGVIALSIIAPFILKSQVNKITICLVVLLQGLSGAVVFYFSQTQSVLLGADGRGYINNGINVTNQTLSYAIRIILAAKGINIVFLQLANFIITLGKVMMYKLYFEKKYNWINYEIAPKTEKLKDRNSYIISEIAWTLFSSTDMLVLSIFVNTQLSSVYAIYNLVFSNLNVLLNAVYSSVSYVLGQAYHDSIRKYEIIHDVFTTVFLGGMTILMCITYVMVIPFIELYTKGVTDIEYVYRSLPVMFCLVQILSWSRFVTGNLTAIAGYAKNTSRISLIEALVNILLSVILVGNHGIVGVLAATVFALPLKVIYCAYLSDKVILKRSCIKTVTILMSNYILFGVIVWINTYLDFNIVCIRDFILYGTIITLLIGSIGFIVNALANPECIKIFLASIKKNKSKEG